MTGFGTLLNIITVLIGGSLGLMVGSKFNKNLQAAVISITGLFSLVIGMQMALASRNLLIVLGSLLVGIIIGEVLRIDDGIENLGNFLERKFSSGEKGRFAKAFITSSIVFCVGPLTILGAIQDGLTGDYTLLATKSLLDGFTSLAFASAMGPGVLFTIITIVFVQGGLTLFAGALSGVMTQTVIAELTGVGGVMILSIGLGILEIKKLKTANMLPALVIAPLIVLIMQKFTGGI